jgi:hypothetical protein
MQTQTQPINLVEIANQLASTAKALHSKVREGGKALTLQASQLASKIPGLEGLGNLNLFRLRETRNGLIDCDTLGIWVGENGEVGVFTPDLIPVPKAQICSYNSGIRGYTIIELEGIFLKTGFNPASIHIEELVNLKVDGIDGEGVPKVVIVSDIPQPETPIYSDEIPHNVELKIIKTGKRSRKFDTPLVDVEVPTGKILKNVICNSELARIVETNGIGAKFKIVGKAPRVNKEGLPIDSEGKVNKAKPSYTVQIADLQLTDFSDLSI